MKNPNATCNPNGDNTGTYDIVVRASNSIIDAGCMVHLEIYISGYGRIENACVGVYPSWSIFNTKESTLRVGDGDSNAPPGDHYINFTFKYFNGESWNAKTSTTKITVRNFYQRNTTPVWVVGGIAAAISIITNILTIIKSIKSSLF
ncbi:MAG: hypothetical protein U1F70_15730 [Candidatus Competibacteraceae bacterium]